MAGDPTGVARLDNPPQTPLDANRIRTYGPADGLANEDAYVVGADALGAILIGTSGGGFRRTPSDRFEPVSKEYGLDEDTPVNAFLVTRDDSL